MPGVRPPFAALAYKRTDGNWVRCIMVQRDARKLAERCGLHHLGFVRHCRRLWGDLQYRKHRLEPACCTGRQGENCHKDELCNSNADSNRQRRCTDTAGLGCLGLLLGAIVGLLQSVSSHTSSSHGPEHQEHQEHLRDFYTGFADRRSRRCY